MILIENDTVINTETDCGTQTEKQMKTMLCKNIVTVEKMCFSVPWTERSIESQVFTEGSINAVIRDDKAENKPVGFICGQSVADECELYRIAVVPSYRKQGIADRLMTYFLDKCRENGIRNVFLEVRCDNEPAKKLYEKYGFSEVGRRRNYYTEPICDALIYKAEL